MMPPLQKIELLRYLSTPIWGQFDVMKRFSLRLTEAEYMKLKIYCEDIHVSMNDVIRELIREWQPKTMNQSKSTERERKCS